MRPEVANFFDTKRSEKSIADLIELVKKRKAEYKKANPYSKEHFKLNLISRLEHVHVNKFPDQYLEVLEELKNQKTENLIDLAATYEGILENCEVNHLEEYKT